MADSVKATIQNKEELRKTMRTWRINVPIAYQKAASAKIVDQLLSQDIVMKAPVLAAYLPTKGEVLIEKIIDAKKKANQTIAVPAFDSMTNGYRYVLFTDWQHVREGKYSIKEPYPLAFVGPTKINVALIPGLAFDRKGNRLGFGFGVMDSLLKNLQKECLVLGVCLSYQLVDGIDVESHDQKVDMIVTEKEEIIVEKIIS